MPEVPLAKSGRVEFPAKVRNVLAERNGYRCSFPACNKLTIGPGHHPDQSASIGVAAHIFSAAPNGPRGRGELGEASLRSAENGIWLCADHSRLVDANRGEQYSAGVLRRFKYLHEARIGMELGHRSLGWIEKLEIHSSRVFAPESVLRLSKVMLVVGPNASGKTFLFRLLNSLSPEMRSNPGKIFLEGQSLSFSIKLWNPEPHNLAWNQTESSFDITLDGQEVLVCPLPVEVFFHEKARGYEPLETYLLRKRRANGGTAKGLDDITLLAEYFQLSEDLVLKLLPGVGAFVNHLVSNARVEISEGNRRVVVEDKKWRPDAPIHKISGGMLEMMAFDFVIAHSLLVAEHSPVLLLLNLSLLGLDGTRTDQYVHFLQSEEVRFQTIFCSPDPRWCKGDIPWEMVRLRKRDGEVHLEEVE